MYVEQVDPRKRSHDAKTALALKYLRNTTCIYSRTYARFWMEKQELNLI